MIGDARIVVNIDGRRPSWEIVVRDQVVYTFEGHVDLVEFLAGGLSSTRYVQHEVPARVRAKTAAP